MVWTEHLPTFMERLVNLGTSPEDTEAEKAHKTAVVAMAGVTVPFAVAWSVMYGFLGLPLSASIPLLYGVISVAGLIVLARTKLIRVFRPTQLAMYLVFPFLLQWSLGGFANGSAVGVWAMAAPLLAHMVGSYPWPWLAGFAGLSIFSGLIEASLAANGPDIPAGVVTTFFALNFLGAAFVIFVALFFFIRERERARAALEEEQQKSERLLLNILPAPIAERLKQGEEPIADRIDQVIVLVADIVGFTPMSEQVPAADVVHVLNDLFSRFDDLTDELGLEKLKTIGDAYQAVGGLPGSNPDQVAAAADLAIAMQSVVADHTFPGFDDIQLRIGINTGPVVAGVIGKRKFSYDLWGDTINTASRMESHGIPGHVQVTETVYEELRDRYDFEPRGTVEVKGKGELRTYLLEGRRSGTGDSAPESEETPASI